jgi:ssDNA thymidine ADP-ribosyltransferase, DarT
VKPDAAAIRAFIEDLPNQPWIRGTSRASWPKYLFRIDDVRASASIINGGTIYSRNRAIQLDLLAHDAAAPAVMENSPEWIKGYVRLYFRPRTPTEYRSEGFRPPAALQMGAHRPMPVVLIFDSAPILTADGTRFTSGNAASASAIPGDTVTFLRAIPFEKVFHEGPLKQSEKADVVFRRCAEVLVPTELSLANLRRILCRSQAEHETLLDLLSDEAKATFSNRIGVSDRVHCKHWTFVESVDKTNALVTFRFNPLTSTPEPFGVRVEFLDPHNVLKGHWAQAAFRANGVQPISIESLGLDWYRVQLTLDGLLAYSGTFGATEALL